MPQRRSLSLFGYSSSAVQHMMISGIHLGSGTGCSSEGRRKKRPACATEAAKDVATTAGAPRVQGEQPACGARARCKGQVLTGGVGEVWFGRRIIIWWYNLRSRESSAAYLHQPALATEEPPTEGRVHRWRNQTTACDDPFFRFGSTAEASHAHKQRHWRRWCAEDGRTGLSRARPLGAHGCFVGWRLWDLRLARLWFHS